METMMQREITAWTALELGRRIRAGEVSVTEALKAYLDNIERTDGSYHAYVSVWREQAFQRARQVEQELKEGKYADSPLAGVPIAVKDNICTKGEETTCASRILAGFRPPYQAEVIDRLLSAGLVIIGKTNMDEFAMGSTTETSAAGATRNPWDTSRVPGGSSGGSAAAVAAFEAPVALGSDTGGSIRQPSAFCGVAGIKPTYGTVSRYGLIAYASSLDQIGPIARSVEDLAAMLEIISGWDEKDSTSVPPEYIPGRAEAAVLNGRAETELSNGIAETAILNEGKAKKLTTGAGAKQYTYLDVIEAVKQAFKDEKDGKDLKDWNQGGDIKNACTPQVLAGLRIGLPKEYFGEGLDQEVKKCVLEAAEVLKSLGARLEEMELPAIQYAIPAYYVLASAEASSNLSRYDGVKYGYRTADYEGLQELYKKTRSEGFGEEVKRRMLIGAFVLSSGYYEAYYNKALKVKAVIKQSFDRAFEQYDLLLSPTAPNVAPRLGESLADPLKMYLGDIYTVAVNLAGLPGISIPVGFAEKDGKRLPVGLQLIGRPFGERELFQAAYAYERWQKASEKDMEQSAEKAEGGQGEDRERRKADESKSTI